MDDALREIGQAFTHLGKPDPRLVGPKQYHHRLHQLLKGLKKDDPPPERVLPVSLCILKALCGMTTSGFQFDEAIRDLCTIGFFYLCRPGESTAPAAQSDAAPFRLCDVEFIINHQCYTGCNVPLPLLAAAQATRLEYTVQKNGNKGDKVAHGRSGHQHLCPVVAIANRVRHLRMHHAAPDTPLYVVFHSNKPICVAARHLTAALRAAATAVAPTTGIDPARISARSLRPGGATALLCAGVDKDTTQLIGRWKSDAMIRYLHLQAAPAMRRYAPAMLKHGTFTFLPGAQQPLQVAPELHQVILPAP